MNPCRRGRGFARLVRRPCHVKRDRSPEDLETLEEKRSRYFAPLHYGGDLIETASLVPAGVPISSEDICLTFPVVEEPEITDILRRAPPLRPSFYKPAPGQDSGSTVESVTGNTPEVPSGTPD